LFLLINIVFVTIFVVNKIDFLLYFTFIIPLAFQLSCNIHIERFKLFKENKHSLNLFKHNIKCISLVYLTRLGFKVRFNFMVFNVWVSNENILIEQSPSKKYIIKSDVIQIT